MKFQYLAIIFLIIILPILMVLTTYIDYHIDAINLKHTYDTKLLDSTYDALKSYQLNTVNNSISDISTSKIDELEAAVKTFYNSISTNFGYTGYKSATMDEYIPAVVFAMYDGYYMYSPYENVLTGVPGDKVDDDYSNNKTLEGLKSYVYYSCRYKIDNDNDFVITYTLDNYITVQGIVDGNYVNKYGYLIDGITKVSDNEYKYDGITLKNTTTECLKEYLGDTEYSYAKLNGTKYYLDETNKQIFYINLNGEKAIQTSDAQNPVSYQQYEDFIEKNNSAYRYYRDAYEFTAWVRDNLSGLTPDNAIDIDISSSSGGSIFGIDNTNNNITDQNNGQYIQDEDSDFNAHREDVIRYTITKNLSTAIAGYNKYFSNAETDFIMPNISETDWELIENNISIITFLQGFKIGGRDYNEYSVVANNLTKEYIDENDIYIVGNDKVYYKVNDTSILNDAFTLLSNGYQPGIWKLNFESRVDATGDYEKKYYPLNYIASYSSVISSTSVDISESDMYKYTRNLANSGKPLEIKKVYYTALARERYGSYSVNKTIEIINIVNDV